jgi:hypothetical protein
MIAQHADDSTDGNITDLSARTYTCQSLSRRHAGQYSAR